MKLQNHKSVWILTQINKSIHTRSGFCCKRAIPVWLTDAERVWIYSRSNNPPIHETDSDTCENEFNAP